MGAGGSESRAALRRALVDRRLVLPQAAAWRRHTDDEGDDAFVHWTQERHVPKDATKLVRVERLFEFLRAAEVVDPPRAGIAPPIRQRASDEWPQMADPRICDRCRVR